MGHNQPVPDAQPAPKPRQRRSTPPAEAILANGRNAAAPTIRKVGRPSAYKPELCEIVMSLGKQGKSPAGIAAALHVERATLTKWGADYPEFSAALARAKAYEQQWWEDRGQKSLGRKHFQAQVWRTSMAARFKEDYTEGAGSVNVTLDLGGAIAEIEARRRPTDAKAVEVASSFAPLADPKKAKE